jgi:multidrug efflux system membrane fusion protein
LEPVETEKMTDSGNPERQQAVSDFPPPATQDLDASSEKAVTAAKRRLWISLAAIVALAITAWAGVRQSRSRAEAASAKDKAPPPTPVVAAPARKGKIEVYLTGLGTVTPVYTVAVKSRVDGQVLKVLYKEGQAVRKGNPLVEIDPRPFEVQLTQAEGQLIKDRAALQNGQVDLQRYQTLIAKNAVAQQIEATQRATVLQDQGAVKIDEGNIASAKLNLTYCHITSPIDGRVGLRLVDPGNMVTASAGTALVVITQTDPITVIFTLPEQQLAPVLKRIRAGEQLMVDALDSDSKTSIARGRLTTVDNQIDQTTGTLKLRAVFSNHDGLLFPNEFVNAQLLVDEKKDVTLVPNAAVQRNGSKTFVYLVKPDHSVTVREVTIGTANAEDSEINSGVSPGDVLVTQGVDKLQEGSVVQAQVQQPGGTVTPSTFSTNSVHEHRNGANASQSGPGQ